MTWSLWSEAKNSASRAMSSGRATRPVGGSDSSDALGSCALRVASRLELDSRRLVSTLPGQMALTVIPCGPSYCAIACVSPITPNFDAV